MIMKKKVLVTLAVAIAATVQTHSQIRVNQVGMYPNQEKIAVVEGSGSTLTIVDNATGKSVAKAKAVRTSVSPWSKKKRSIVDFSSLAKPGTYTLRSGKHTAIVTIGESALRKVATATLKAFYLTRSGIAIDKRYGGDYARPCGHPDTLVCIHSSAVSPGRPEGAVISSPGGWYDAGDYNKYIVNSAFSIGVMLCSYEQNKEFYDGLSTNIPESSNSTADLLDELYYNLRWMLTMQDPYDGGVYHKLTTPNFEAFVMPADCHQQRYVVQKSTAATLDFAAVMAQAARIYQGNTDYPDFAQQAARAALAAYGWAVRNPKVYYRQTAMNGQYKPAINTGEYGDGGLSDEWFWAATELLLLTTDKTFAEVAANNRPQRFSPPTWGNVAALGIYEAVTRSTPLTAQLSPLLLSHCDSLLATMPTSSFHTSCGNAPRDYGWGCLAETFGANGMTMLYAYSMTGDKRYLAAAQHNADYVLGRNATGYCYITGFGNRSPQHPHHRLSEADGIAAPYPGLLVGGPNPAQQDIAEVKAYPSKQPDESYSDVMPSYASNEIAINWNASILALLAGVEAHSR